MQEPSPPGMVAPSDSRWMAEALNEARSALEIHEVPVGAIVVRSDCIIGRAHNLRELLQSPIAHAEILALEQAAGYLGTWRLSDCSLYVTLEPCAMCAGAIVLARMGRLVFGASDPKAGACGSVFDIPRDARLNHQVEVVSGVLAGPCGELLQEFFREKRSDAAF